jgi:hypothetical protein
MHEDGAAGDVPCRQVLDPHLPHAAATQTGGLGRVKVSSTDEDGATLSGSARNPSGPPRSAESSPMAILSTIPSN